MKSKEGFNIRRFHFKDLKVVGFVLNRDISSIIFIQQNFAWVKCVSQSLTYNIPNPFMKTQVNYWKHFPFTWFNVNNANRESMQIPGVLNWHFCIMAHFSFVSMDFKMYMSFLLLILCRKYTNFIIFCSRHNLYKNSKSRLDFWKKKEKRILFLYIHCFPFIS